MSQMLAAAAPDLTGNSVLFTTKFSQRLRRRRIDNAAKTYSEKFD